MNKQEQINKWVDEAIESVSDIKRAHPMPFLLTRVNARLSKSKETLWEKASWFIGRPAFAIPGLAMLIFINVMVVVFTGPDPNATSYDSSAFAPTDEFSYTVSAIYDFENPEP